VIYLILSSRDEEEDMNLVIINNKEDNSNDIQSDYLSNIALNQSNYSTTNNKQNLIEEEEKLLNNKLEKSSLLAFQLSINREKLLSMIENTSIINLFVKGFFKITSKPWEMLLDLFVPKSNEGFFLIIQFLVPLFFIWNVSEIELFILSKMVGRLNVPPSFLGLTIMSWGNNAPDMFNVASAMAKGMVDLALNAAIASEIHNILLGMGLPWLVYNCSVGKEIVFNTGDLYAFTLFFFCFFILIFILALKVYKNKLDGKFAFFLFIIYLLFLLLIFILTFKNS
jgi:Ca2+/Na+ antiporter